MRERERESERPDAPSPSPRLALLGLMATAASPPASAQVISLDSSSPTVLVGACDCGSLGAYTITEGDLLIRNALDLRVNPLFPCTSPLPTCMPTQGPATPRTLIWDVDPAGGLPGTYFTLGLDSVTGCHGDGFNCPMPPPPESCNVEVDAVSGGLSGLGSAPFQPSRIKFSVDRLSTGVDVMGSITGILQPCVPTVYTEAPSQDAHGDIFASAMALPGVPPFVDPWQLEPLGNVGVTDGEGCRNAAGGHQYPGTGLVEPALAPPDGDEIDALEVEELDLLYDPQQDPVSCPVYFSLDRDSAIANRAHLGLPNLGPADILAADVTAGTVILFIEAADLGLDPEEDDVDALAIGFPGDQRCQVPAIDNPVGVLFSVTRDSAIVGEPDSLYQVPIAPGDILRPPQDLTVPMNPEIYIPAELLGLVALRDQVGQIGVVPDDLDALALNWNGAASILDCDGNGVEDAVDIALGSEDDCDANGIPDACEITDDPVLDFDGDGVLDQCQSLPATSAFCFGDLSAGVPCPCINESLPGSGEGCVNSTGSGAILSAYGSRWTANQACLSPNGPGTGNLSRLVLTATQLPPGEVCTFFQGEAWENFGNGSPFGSDGLLCVATANGIKIQVVTADAVGTASTTVDIASVGGVQVGTTKYYQARYRDDTTQVCGTGQNTTNGLSILWDPSN